MLNVEVHGSIVVKYGGGWVMIMGPSLQPQEHDLL